MSNVWSAPRLQVDLASWRAQSAAMYPAHEHLLFELCLALDLYKCLRRDLNMSATNIPGSFRFTNIDPNDVMILPHEANPRRI